MVPADSRLISAKDLNVNQSALTGESFPADKSALPLEAKITELTDWSNYVFLGTSLEQPATVYDMHSNVSKKETIQTLLQNLSEVNRP
jgi:Mg2+-importing ATPase